MSSSPPTGQSPHPKPWEQTNPWVAGVLAYLIPGAGHFYQGRTLKGIIYCVSILGLFWWGQKLGEGMVVYNLPDKGGALRYVSLSYAAQLGAGACALPAMLQQRRADNPSNHRTTRLLQSLDAEFQGVLNATDNGEPGQLQGTIHLEPAEGQFGPEVRGTFDGKLDGQPAKLNLGGRFEIDKPIKAGFRRRLTCGVAEEGEEPHMATRMIVGTIPRSFFNAYGSPPDADQLQDLNGRLGKLYELALVFTWIAGLLNVLAIWDCVFGPAYGFGDEHALAMAAEKASPPSMESPVLTNSTPSSESPHPDSRPTQKSPV